MGESEELKNTVLAQASEDAMVAHTMGGRMHVRCDDTAQATPHGQIVFFAEFLATAGVFDRWVDECPLRYISPNASSAHDVLGTLMLGILAGRSASNSRSSARPMRSSLSRSACAASMPNSPAAKPVVLSCWR